MTILTLKALTGAAIPKDRSTVTLNMETDQGTVDLKMTAALLDHFVTSLQGLEQQLTILDPVAGRAPGEGVQMRLHAVDGTDVGMGVVNNVPSLAVIIKSGDSTRTYAFDRRKADELVKKVTDAIPRLASLDREQSH